MESTPKGRLKLAVATATVLVLAGVPAVVVLAAGSEEARSPERGTHDELRFAQPPRDEPPVVAMRGTAPGGQPFALRVSRPAADSSQVCVDIEFEDPAPGPEAPAGPLSAGFCADPSQRPLAAVVDETYVDPVTFKPLPSPRRLVYGFTSLDQVSEVQIVTPDGAARAIRHADAPSLGVGVFGGAAPASSAGEGTVTASDSGGRSVERQVLDFHGPAHQAAPAAIPSDHSH